MIVGIGTDIAQRSRIEASLERLGDKFAKRILTPEEMQDFSSSNQPSVFLTKRFAAKEAVGKALGTGIGRGVSFQHIQINHNENGAPLLQLTDGAAERLQALGGKRTHISIADEVDYATTFVILES
jgi:holo-[acyl-carrier protein] synthase